ncbi:MULTISPECIES: aldo/keto reductase [Streptomyces]|jgi:aryl-alcohol dehydrogenase-like predicted oxidoreductase|uniref:Aldo/keto reductase n=1 Tax=Streptomyces thermoviolaceus subsp. thermoviolaceus TaxID=66860 RepID=A0ABX0YNM0_STRTL|nr:MULTISPECIES: aldo/keto reductase [Streptomyces]MCM3264043.1 aldo/keto reductase [Streptomyces thermoviolaceus]NJP12936.1 aldo/keto reductase [Streptomyces thermoviolaceus subsp. thermoviolaceus]RSR96776.1 aldo/keto reductase [Streptomyces sp. WAC00469]WTD49900.1 aldo/keto reductase [Streptomyces thermoviolaceus]GGV67676.1 oxidoreductase [Streptomyces thermoviolaceus subsp. apingens]
MEQRQLGRTGLRVSRIGLGTLTWGRDVDEHAAAEMLKAFWEAGGTLVDTADVYGDGEAEYLLGRLMENLVPRRELIISTKAGSVPDPDRRFDCSRGHLLSALDASLARLGTDYVDVWHVHAYDPYTPLEETLQALDVAIGSGRVRYAGVSNFCGWQLAKAATWQLAAPGARTRLASTQMEYSLLQRGVEREVLPAAIDLGIGMLPSSPLGRGVLTGKYRNGTPPDSRGASEHLAPFVEPYLDETAGRIVDAVTTAADGLAVTPLQVALAWVRDRPGVTAPIVGARTAQQLTAALSVEALSLPEEICRALDDVSAPVHRYPDHDWSTL